MTKTTIEQITAPASVRVRTLDAQMSEYTGTHFLPENDADLIIPDFSRCERVEFPAIDGSTIVGNLYRPKGVSGAAPAVAICGPISAVKEQVVPSYAERLADAGYLCVTFDPRRFGESGGAPRGYYNPEDVIADFHATVRYLFGRDDVDTNAVSALGVCMGGGFAVSLGAREHRLKSVVAVAGGYNIGGTFQKMMGVDGYGEFIANTNATVQKQVDTGELQTIPTIAKSQDETAVRPNPEAYSFYHRTSNSYAPNWNPDMPVQSLEPYLAYNAVAEAPLVAPTPLMIIHGTLDVFLLPEFAQAAYDAAQGSKELVWIDTHNHIELYDQAPYVNVAVEHALRWLGQDASKSASE